MNNRVYLAGPDVFFKNAKDHARFLKDTCFQQGLEGVFPLDAEIAVGPFTDKPEIARRIFAANVKLIDSCAGVLANMMPFRGPSTDPGTAWEMGYAFARGLPVVGYTTDTRLYTERVTPDKYETEAFEIADNLMLVYGCNSYPVLGDKRAAFDTAASRMAWLLTASDGIAHPRPGRGEAVNGSEGERDANR